MLTNALQLNFGGKGFCSFYDRKQHQLNLNYKVCVLLVKLLSSLSHGNILLYLRVAILSFDIRSVAWHHAKARHTTSNPVRPHASQIASHSTLPIFSFISIWSSGRSTRLTIAPAATRTWSPTPAARFTKITFDSPSSLSSQTSCWLKQKTKKGQHNPCTKLPCETLDFLPFRHYS